MAIIMERRLLLYTARSTEGGHGWGTAPSLSEKLMIRYHKTRDDHVKMEWPPIEFPSAFILIVRSLASRPQECITRSYSRTQKDARTHPADGTMMNAFSTDRLVHQAGECRITERVDALLLQRTIRVIRRPG